MPNSIRSHFSHYNSIRASSMSLNNIRLMLSSPPQYLHTHLLFRVFSISILWFVQNSSFINHHPHKKLQRGRYNVHAALTFSINVSHLIASYLLEYLQQLQQLLQSEPSTTHIYTHSLCQSIH